MPSVLIQSPLAPEELSSLKKEFPAYDFLLYDPDSPLAAEEWGEVEILYGPSLANEQLIHAHRLRWIHVPSPSLADICLQDVEQTSNLLITNSKEHNVETAAEFVMGSILLFAKNFYEWRICQREPKALFHSPYRELMWGLRDRILLQIGLGPVGSSVVEKGQLFGMRTWGMYENPTFHPHCLKTFDYGELNSLLPACDVVSVAIPRGEPVPPLLQAEQLALMKGDSILIILGSDGVIDEKALLAELEKGKFRGVVIDATLPKHKKQFSPLYKNLEVIVTPEVSRFPQEEHHLEYQLFRYNFRRYIHSDFEGMKNLVRQTPP